MLRLTAPVLLPDGFLAALGYRHGRRLVALYWEPCGDEACFADGTVSACGLCDDRVYQEFVRRPEVAAWVADHGLHFGDSERQADHWLVVDAVTGEVGAAPWREARSALVRQRQREKSEASRVSGIFEN